jgi:hypothetical protein
MRGGMDGVHGLGEQIAAALASHRAHSDAHQDVAHQDVDIDVVLTHIDADGDGVITTAEAKSASTGAVFVQLGPSAAIGCFGGVLCYAICRLCCMYRRGTPGGGMRPRCSKTVRQVGGTAGGKGCALEVPANARMRKRNSECGPAIAC